MTPSAPTKTAPHAKPQKRPAQASSQDAGMHPPKKQRLDAAAVKSKGTVKVANASAGARAFGGKGAGKGKETVGKVGEKEGGKRADGLIAVAPAAGEKALAAKTAQPTKTIDAAVEKAPAAKTVQTTKTVDQSTRTVDAGPKSKETDKTATETTASSNVIPPVNQNTTKPTASHTDTPAGPSKPKQPTNPPKKTKSTRKENTNVNGKQPKVARRMPPVKPLTADAQNALGRPKKASGSNATRGVEGRDVVFVTRKTSLGSYMRRGKTLLVEDGLNQITLHALCVAIPHAVMLLYALTDILPFPRQFIHHEIQTSSVECHDEMSLVAAELQKGGVAVTDKGKGKDKALAIFEEDEAGIRSRTKSGIRITIRIGKGARVSAAEHENPSAQTTRGKKARPNNAQRVARRAQENINGDGDADMGEPVEMPEEEERMNEDIVEVTKAAPPKEQTKTPATKSPWKGEKTGGTPTGAKKQKKGGVKQKPRTSAVAMDVD